MIFSILLLVILILINGVLSASELAFLSIEKFELDKMVRQRKKNAKKIRKVLEDPSSFLSTIQVGITLAGFLSSAFAASTFANKIMESGFMIINKGFTNSFLIVIITIILSYFTLVFGELVPKKIALSSPFKVASLFVTLINIMQVLFYPLIKLLSFSTDIICKLLKIKEQNNDFTEEDIKRIILTGTRDGIIEKKEQEYIFNIFQFNDTTVDKVMTPKEDCELINVNIKFGALLKRIKNTKYTRYPVYDKDTNNIIGIFNVKDYIMYKKDNDDFNLRNLLFKVKKFQYDEKIDDVFASMQKEHIQMAIVVKNKKFIGVVTLEDAVEEILGNIYDEYDEDDE
ncbi:MAG: HlyC/CorC family transporter [Bacilli bacterium]|nr:HlyC/CorC family transporter [Bacilli bacterium]